MRDWVARILEPEVEMLEPIEDGRVLLEVSFVLKPDIWDSALKPTEIGG